MLLIYLETAANLNIIFENSDGEVLHQDALGMQKAGLVGFEWKDFTRRY